MATDFSNTLKWFSGKSLENAKVALGMLAESEELGYWVPGSRASVKVPAALSKSNVAVKIAKNNKWMEWLGAPNERARFDDEYEVVAKMGWALRHAMYFGGVGRSYEMDFDRMLAACKSDEERKVVALGKQFMEDFAPVTALVAQLDATKPMPKFTSIKASPLITQTLKDMGLLVKGNEATVRMCPMEFERIERKDPKTGKVYYVFVTKLLWPEGTRHHTSRHGHDGQHCEACGHSIRNPFNWVPMLVDDDKGIPRSMWVGRDCAETLFGVEMTGDLEIVNR